jgi:hypothetical protein
MKEVIRTSDVDFDDFSDVHLTYWAYSKNS